MCRIFTTNWFRIIFYLNHRKMSSLYHHISPSPRKFVKRNGLFAIQDLVALFQNAVPSHDWALWTTQQQQQNKSKNLGQLWWIVFYNGSQSSRGLLQLKIEKFNIWFLKQRLNLWYSKKREQTVMNNKNLLLYFVNISFFIIRVKTLTYVEIKLDSFLFGSLGVLYHWFPPSNY